MLDQTADVNRHIAVARGVQGVWVVVVVVVEESWADESRESCIWRSLHVSTNVSPAGRHAHDSSSRAGVQTSRRHLGTSKKFTAVLNILDYKQNHLKMSEKTGEKPSKVEKKSKRDKKEKKEKKEEKTKDGKQEKLAKATFSLLADDKAVNPTLSSLFAVAVWSHQTRVF